MIGDKLSDEIAKGVAAVFNNAECKIQCKYGVSFDITRPNFDYTHHTHGV